MTVVLGPDGLRARDNGAWGREKLEFLDLFGPPALLATAKKRQRYYVDLFAGPGLNVARDSGVAFDGSPLRALRMTALSRPDLHFTHAHLVNANGRDDDALHERVRRLREREECRVSEARTTYWRGDANGVLPTIMRGIHPKAYAFVFADIEAPSQWPWSSVTTLHEMGHTSIDLYMLFPLDMAIMRLLCFVRSNENRYARVLDTFFGTDAWKELADRRITDAHSPVLRQAILDLYIGRLREHWPHTGVVRDIRRRGNHYLYKMLFASRSDVADRIARAVRSRDQRETQIGLPL